MRSNEFAYLFDSRFPAVILEYSKCIKLHSYTSKYTSTQNLGVREASRPRTVAFRE